MKTPLQLIRKFRGSMEKRLRILLTGGYSIGKAYGAYFLLDWRHSIDKKVATKLYEHGQILFMLDMLRKHEPVHFFDIGAHAGLYSIVAKTCLPRLQVHAFEPDKINLRQLYANLFLNKFESGFTVHEFALSDVSGSLLFDTSENTSRGTRKISATGNRTIEARLLDDVITDKGSTAFFKIDTEGHECAIIRGAEKFLRSNHCILQVESFEENADELGVLMKQLGYRLIGKPADYYYTNMETV